MPKLFQEPTFTLCASVQGGVWTCFAQTSYLSNSGNQEVLTPTKATLRNRAAQPFQGDCLTPGAGFCIWGWNYTVGKLHGSWDNSLLLTKGGEPALHSLLPPSTCSLGTAFAGAGIPMTLCRQGNAVSSCQVSELGAAKLNISLWKGSFVTGLSCPGLRQGKKNRSIPTSWSIFAKFFCYFHVLTNSCSFWWKVKQTKKSRLVFLDLSWGRQQDLSAGRGKAVGLSSMAGLTQPKPAGKCIPDWVKSWRRHSPSGWQMCWSN